MVKSEGGNKDEVVVDVPIEQHDINAVYAAELKVLGTKAPKEVHVVADDQKQEDYYKNFRTNVGVTPASRETTDKQVLLAWTMSNGVLAVVILCVLQRVLSEENIAHSRQTSGGNSSLATTYMGILL